MNPAAVRAYIAATVVYARHRAIADAAAQQRATALLAMSQSGMTYRQIAQATGMSASRVGQLVSKLRPQPADPVPAPWPTTP